MSLRIFNTPLSPIQQFIDILTHYFKQSSAQDRSNNQLFINTKYYSCKVPIIIHDSLTYEKQEKQQKTDMILFLIGQQEHIQEIGKKIDGIMKQFNPQSSMICVHTKNTYDENQWHHQQQINECESFVPIIYENILKMKQILPTWSSQGLLIQNGEQYQMFGIFDLIQTTTWSNLTKKQLATKKHKQEQTKVSQKQQVQQKAEKKENIIKQGNNQQKSQIKLNKQSEQEMQEEQMEKQMVEFEMLMQQMMEVRSMPANGNQRKQRAEDLIMRLAKTIGQQ